MKDFIKNFVPCFAITVACLGGSIGFMFLFLALLPASAGTMTATEVANVVGGWQALFDWMPILLLLSVLVAAWVAAMSPFTRPREAFDENGDIVFVEPMIN